MVHSITWVFCKKYITRSISRHHSIIPWVTEFICKCSLWHYAWQKLRAALCLWSPLAHRQKCPTAVLQNHGGLWYIPTGSRVQQHRADLTFTPIIPQSKMLRLTVSIADSSCKCYILKEGEDYTDSLAISSLLLLTGLGTRRASFKYSRKVLSAVQRPLSTLCWNQQVNQP